MAIILKAGQKRKSYEIVRELNRGAFAIAYEARQASGEKAFFKQYKSPTPRVDWYTGFVDHQNEIKRRIESDPAAKDRCYRFVEFFEDGREFFQVFEYVEGGMDLTKCLEQQSSFSWSQLVVFAKVMMFGMKGLHQVRIVHTDLKPDNIYLIPDAAIGMGYKLRIIDLDWAICSDRQAPWHGKQGYVGTALYQSPEHLNGKVPLPASDVFTCGIMLGEILAGKHPFSRAGAGGYEAAVKAGNFEPIRVIAPIGRVESPAFLESILNSCLDPDPGKRPTAAQVCDALLGKTFAWHSAPVPKPAPRSEAPKPPPPPPKAAPVAAKAVEISFNNKHVTTVGTDADLGKQLFKSLDGDAQFLSNPQFRLLKRGTSWYIKHCESATNETIVNGRKLHGEELVAEGMRVSVGNSAKGVEKFPLQLRLKG